jgi:hypothetical protein
VPNIAERIRPDNSESIIRHRRRADLLSRLVFPVQESWRKSRIREGVFLSRRYLRWLAEKIGDAPDRHRGVQDNRWPQKDSGRLRLETGGSEDEHRAEIVDDHRGDDSARGAALRIETREPAGHAQREQRHAGQATEWDGSAGDFRSEQDPDDAGGYGDQPQSRGDFNEGRNFVQTVHSVVQLKRRSGLEISANCWFGLPWHFPECNHLA